MLTIHNIGYQGNVEPPAAIKGWDIERIVEDELSAAFLLDPHPEWKSVNPLRLAMELAHQVNTVSPNYKKEMTEPEDQARYFEGGKGLHEVARRLDDAVPGGSAGY